MSGPVEISAFTKFFTKDGACMLAKGGSKRIVDVNCFDLEQANSKVLEEVASNDRLKELWAKALKKSRGNEYKAKTLYVQYRAQLIRDEAETAKKLLREPSATIIQNYITKMGAPDPKEKKQLQNRPKSPTAQKSRKKKCYKCRVKVSLEVKPCPICNCNSFVFCN